MDDPTTDNPPVPPQPDKRHAMASLYCALPICVSLFPSPLVYMQVIVSVAGIIVGVLSLWQIHHAPDRYAGKALAWIGVVANILVIIIAGGVIANFQNDYQRYSQYGKSIQIFKAIRQYAYEHHDALPSTLDQVPISPATLQFLEYAYYGTNIHHRYIVYNRHLAGVKTETIAYPERTIVLLAGIPTKGQFFDNLTDIETAASAPYGCVVTFLNGQREPLNNDTLSRHFPTNGALTPDTWFIEPQLKK